VLVPVLAAALSFSSRSPRGAQSTGVCPLVTRREVGELLRAKVVKTENDESTANGAQQCTYMTKKVVKEFTDQR
jgi:hypothetical protein